MAVSAVPVVELRGSIPLGLHTFGLGWPAVYAAAVAGNMLPVPFILLFMRRVFKWLMTFKRLAPLVRRLEKRAHLKGRVMKKYAKWGLLILVAIPLPGTGAWTGALAAAALDMRIKTAFPAIMAGVMIAGAIVTLVSLGVIHVFS